MTTLVSNIASLSVGTAGNVAGPTASGAPLATTAAGGATSGMFGTGGQLDLEATMSFLSKGLNLASASASIFAADQKADAQLADARQQARALDMQAREEEIEAQLEETRGKQESNDIMDQLRRTLASQKLAAASQGVDIGFGTPVSVNEATRDLADMQLSVTRGDAQIRALARRRQAAALGEERINTLVSGKRTAANTRSAGRIEALGTTAELAQRRARRG